MYNNKADLWSIGMILYEMLYGTHPFNSCRTVPELKDTITNTTIEIPPSNTKNKDVSEKCIALLKQLLQKKANDRIIWNDFFENSWIKSYQCIFPQHDEYEKKLQSTSVGSLSNEEFLNTPRTPVIEIAGMVGNTDTLDIACTPEQPIILKSYNDQINVNIIDNYCDQVDKYTTSKSEAASDDFIFEMDMDDIDKEKNKKIRVKKIIEKSSVLNENDNAYDIVDSF